MNQRTMTVSDVIEELEHLSCQVLVPSPHRSFPFVANHPSVLGDIVGVANINTAPAAITFLPAADRIRDKNIRWERKGVEKGTVIAQVSFQNIDRIGVKKLNIIYVPPTFIQRTPRPQNRW